MGMEGPQKRHGQMEPKNFTSLTRAAALAAAVVGSAQLLPKNPDRQDNKTERSVSIDTDRASLNKLIEEINTAPRFGFTNDSFTEEECLVRNAYHESRGETLEGKVAVILTTLERVLDKEFPKTICGVVFQKNAFSWTRDKRILEQPIDQREFLKISITVHEIMKGNTVGSAAVAAHLKSGLPRGALFYKKVGFVGSTHVEKFFASLKFLKRIGNHDFFLRNDSHEKKSAAKSKKGPSHVATRPVHHIEKDAQGGLHYGQL